MNGVEGCKTGLSVENVSHCQNYARGGSGMEGGCEIRFSGTTQCKKNWHCYLLMKP